MKFTSPLRLRALAAAFAVVAGYLAVPIPLAAQPGAKRAASPLFHADKIRRPLIVLQGANDPRVIKPESDEIVEAVKKNNVPVEYVVFDNEGHGFTKKANEIRASQSILEFLDKHLKKGATATAGK